MNCPKHKMEESHRTHCPECKAVREIYYMCHMCFEVDMKTFDCPHS